MFDKKAYAAKWYKENKASHIKNTGERRNRIRTENRLYIQKLKEETPCTDCGKYYPHYVMDFDHQKDKLKDISLMMNYPLKRIIEEIAKCEIVCSNCHRERTHGPVTQRIESLTFNQVVAGSNPARLSKL